MNKLGLFLQKFALDYVIKYLKNNKSQVIKSANAKVNLPILNEKQEAELLEIGFDMSLEMVQLLDKK